MGAGATPKKEAVLMPTFTKLTGYLSSPSAEGLAEKGSDIVPSGPGCALYQLSDLRQ